MPVNLGVYTEEDSSQQKGCGGINPFGAGYRMAAARYKDGHVAPWHIATDQELHYVRLLGAIYMSTSTTLM